MAVKRRGVGLTYWDARLLGRSVAIGALAFLLAWLVTAVSDEGGLSLAERVGRTLPLAPFCAAIGVWGALAPVRARGEVLALEALGRTRGGIAATAVCGGVAVALICSVAVASPRFAGAASFYPTAPHAASWRWDAEAFWDDARGVRIAADGEPHFFRARPRNRTAAAPLAIPTRGRAAAAIATALAGVAMTLLTARALLGGEGQVSSETQWAGSSRVPLPRGALADALAVALALTLTIVIFQVAAARRIPAMAGVWPPTGLLVLAWQRYRRLL
jgi:hypothetical protein